MQVTVKLLIIIVYDHKLQFLTGFFLNSEVAVYVCVLCMLKPCAVSCLTSVNAMNTLTHDTHEHQQSSTSSTLIGEETHLICSHAWCA